MKFQTILKIFQERMAEANIPLLIILGFFGMLVFTIILWRTGSGFLVALSFILTGLLLTKSDTINGLSLMGRYVLIVVLTFYAFFVSKNRCSFTTPILFLFLLPFVMLINSSRTIDRLDALGQSILFLLFYIGLVLGGRKILGDARGRATFAKTLAVFSIIICCIQIPFWSTYTESGKLEGVFENVVGMMTVGMAGIIILTWFAMRQRAGSFSFFFFIFFTVLTFVLLILTGGRTALAASMLGVTVILARKLKRNMVISLVAGIILAPIGFRVATSFVQFEAVKMKLFSQQSSGRSKLFALAWQEIKARPVFGWGTGSSTIKGELATEEEYHNSYLQFAIEHGIPFGLVMLSLFLWLPFRSLFLMKTAQTMELKDMASLSGAFISAYVFANFLGGGLLTTSGILPMFTAIALQEGVYAECKKLEKYGINKYEQESLLDHDYEQLIYVDSQGEIYE